MTDKLVLREDRDQVCYLTLNRPERLNALNLALFEQLEAHIETLGTQQSHVSCIVVTGAGKCFSAGHDLQDIANGGEPKDPYYQTNVISALANLPQPVVMAVRGHCYTGALELALGGDFILASETARFADTHTKFGLAPAWGMSVRLPRKIGRANAMEMMFAARTYSAEEALGLGLADRLFLDTEFDAEVAKFCGLMTRNAPHSVFGYKRLVRENLELPLDEGLVNELRNSPGLSPDYEDRIASFLKR